MVHRCDSYRRCAEAVRFHRRIYNHGVTTGVGDQEQYITFLDGRLGNHHIPKSLNPLIGAALAGAGDGARLCRRARALSYEGNEPFAAFLGGG